MEETIWFLSVHTVKVMNLKHLKNHLPDEHRSEFPELHNNNIPKKSLKYKEKILYTYI